MPGESWRYGDMTTTPSGRIRRSEARRHCKRAERLRNLRAPRPARLPKPKPMIIKIKPADSRYEQATIGGGRSQPLTVNVGGFLLGDMLWTEAKGLRLFAKTQKPRDQWQRRSHRAKPTHHQ